MRRSPLQCLAFAVLAAVSRAYTLAPSCVPLRAPLRRIAMLAATKAEDPAVTKAASALLVEVGKEDRSMASIDKLVGTLETTPRNNNKIKKAVLGDWKLVYATDADAVKLFTSGGADGPFAVLEDVYLRLQSGSEVQSIEVVRKIGPFGNVAQSLFGKFQLGGGGEDEADTLSWRPTYMVNERGREVDAPSDAAARKEWQLTHVSSELLVLRRTASSYVVCTKLAKGKLSAALEEAAVDADLILGI